jgi:predicted glycosyltransferase
VKVLFDIGHPAHVHIFKNVAWGLQREGHECVFTTRDKEMAVYLLEKCGFRYFNFGRHYRSLPGKVVGLVRFDLKMLRCILAENPDLLVSHGSMYAAHAAWLTGRPHVSLEDTENSIEQIRVYAPFSKVILTSRNFPLDFGEKQVRYDGFHELAYLHPRVFDPADGLRRFPRGERRRVLVRFTAWEASHDRGQKGLTTSFKRSLIADLSTRAEVVLSSERPLEADLEPFRLKIPPEAIHEYLATLDLYIGEGSTMASECAMLGVPSIYVNTQYARVVQDQCEEYGLISWETDPERVRSRAMEVLDDPGSGDIFRRRREELLSKNIDVSSFLQWFLQTFPGSLRECRDGNAGVMARFL